MQNISFRNRSLSIYVKQDVHQNLVVIICIPPSFTKIFLQVKHNTELLLQL